MKLIFYIFVALFAVANADKCTFKQIEIPNKWVDMNKGCVTAVRRQIQEEVGAAMKYLAMGAHFSQDKINRPGFAKMFFEHASEERGHAIKLIKYLLVRGELFEDLSELIMLNNTVEVIDWKRGVDALKYALELETSVTEKIEGVIKLCENTKKPGKQNDYELVDYLTGEFLREQYEGQRDLAGKMSTLGKMMDMHGALGEFLFDKNL